MSSNVDTSTFGDGKRSIATWHKLLEVLGWRGCGGQGTSLPSFSWLVGELNGWLGGWLVGWLVGCVLGCLNQVFWSQLNFDRFGDDFDSGSLGQIMVIVAFEIKLMYLGYLRSGWLFGTAFYLSTFDEKGPLTDKLSICPKVLSKPWAFHMSESAIKSKHAPCVLSTWDLLVCKITVRPL